MNNFSNKILNELQAKQVTPKARWIFVAHNYIIWAVGGLFLIIGGVATGTTIYFLQNNDWDLYAQGTMPSTMPSTMSGAGGWVRFMLTTLPYFWIGLGAIFLLLLHYQIRHTKTGYRYSVLAILLWSISLSLLLGVVFSMLGLGRVLHHALNQHVQFYPPLVQMQHEIWDEPTQGRLAGVVIEVEDPIHFELNDIQGNDWEVVVQVVEFAPPVPIVQAGDFVRMIGEPIDADTFSAEVLRVKPEDFPGSAGFPMHVLVPQP